MANQQFLYDCFVELPKLYDEQTIQNQVIMQEKMKEFAYQHGLSENMTYHIAKGDYSSYGKLVKEMQQRGLLESDEVVLPDGMKEIPEEAFLGCDSIRKVTIPASVESIGWEAFSCCDKLEQVEFREGSNLLLIEADAFAESKKFSEINIPDSANIQFNAFLDTEYLYQLIAGQRYCPENVFLSLFDEDRYRVCTMSQEMPENAKAFLMRNSIDAIHFALIDNDFSFREYAAERVKKIIDLAGTKENISEMMEAVIDGTEATFNYTARAEIMDYQKEKGLFPDNKGRFEL